MPVVSMFYGIIIYMYFSDNEKHNEPHIHIRYSGKKAVISINSGKVLSGQIDNKTYNLVVAWMDLHREELLANWELAITQQTIYRIEPLK